MVDRNPSHLPRTHRHNLCLSSGVQLARHNNSCNYVMIQKGYRTVYKKLIHLFPDCSDPHQQCSQVFCDTDLDSSSRRHWRTHVPVSLLSDRLLLLYQCEYVTKICFPSQICCCCAEFRRSEHILCHNRN